MAEMDSNRFQGPVNPLGERIAALEVKVQTLETMTADTHKKVEEMHALVLQAKGAKWLMGTLIFGGGFLAGTIGKILPFLSAKP